MKCFLLKLLTINKLLKIYLFKSYLISIIYCLICVCIGAVCNLIIEHGGEVIREREFCIGAELTFTCSLAESAYDWIIPSFLNGTLENGRISVGSSETVGEFMLSASGDGATRMSTLQVTLFEGFVGNRDITCRETGTTIGGQSATITVLGEY